MTIASAFQIMRRQSYWYGNGGIASLALSAIDMALWDLQGKLVDTSVVDLLGGPRHASLPVLASGHPQSASLSELIEEVATEAVGTAGVKSGMATGSPANLGASQARDTRFAAGLREALGDDAIIALDARAVTQWSFAEAVRRIRELEEWNLAWIEEPLPHGDLATYRELRTKVNLAIGHGEKFWTVSDYSRLAASRSADIVGIDIARAEGITGSYESIRLIESAGMHFNSHSWSGVLSELASLALSFASPSTLYFERKPSRNFVQYDLGANPVKISNGRVLPPTGIGLGIEIDEQAVRNLASNQ